MVRLFRGARGRGIPGFPMMPGRFRHPPPFEPEYHDFGHPNFRGGMSRAFPRGQTPLPLPRPPHLSPTRMIPPNHPPPSRLMSPLRHTHPPSPRMIPPNHPLSSRMIPPLPPRDLQIPPPRERTRSLPLPRGPLPIPPPRLPMHPHMSPVIPGPPFQRPIPPHPSLIRGRGRGGLGHRGVKRLGGAVNGRSRKTQKRKEITEEMEVNKPWVTDSLRAAIHKKYELFEIAKEKKSDADWQAYKDQRIIVGEMKNAAKLEYIGSNPDADVEQIMFGGHPKGYK